MLREEKKVRQIPGEPRRRWFCDDYFDLIAWLEVDGSLWGFQLCYDRERYPRALTWTKPGGYKHDGIDDGEGGAGPFKGSPILVQDGLFDYKEVGARLAAAAGELPPDYRDFILEKLRHPGL